MCINDYNSSTSNNISFVNNLDKVGFLEYPNR